MTDNGKNNSDESSPPEEPRSPKLVSSRPGRVVSIAGLVERIVRQFHEEHDDRSVALQEADTDAKRRGLVREVAEYVFAVESVQLALKDQADIMARVNGEIFGYGPLDLLFQNERITTIQLTGAEKVSVRYAPGEDLTVLEPLFDDVHHLRRALKRLLSDAGAELRDDLPAIETGLIVNERPVAISVLLPPFTPEISADIRLHPTAPRTLDSMVESGYLPVKAAVLLRAIAESDSGFVIVGDTESGKTTLLSALAAHLPHPDKAAAVERAGELRLSEGVERFTVRWETDTQPGITFAEQVASALAAKPQTLLLDEVRADEPGAITPLLSGDDAPRLIWSFRGTSDSKRTRTALATVARMTEPAQSEIRVAAMYQRLAFVITVKRRRGKIELREIAEWQWQPGAEYPDYVELMAPGWEGVEMTGKRPSRTLALPEDFWSKADGG